MVPGDCLGIPVKDSQSSKSDYAETAHEGSPEPEPSTSMHSTHLRCARDESGPLMINVLGKCCFEEIDYSYGLWWLLYEKEELVNGLKGCLCNLKSEQLKSLQEQNQDLYIKAQSEIEGQKAQIAGLENFIQQHEQPAPTVTPNLDTIKKLRRRCGISFQTHLVSISAKDDHNPPCKTPLEQVTPTPPEANTSMLPMPMIIEAVTNGVRSALTSMFDGSQFPPNIKWSPQRRKIENKEVVEEKRAESKEEHAFLLEKTQDLFKEKFGYTQDVEFIMCASADSDNVRSCQYEDGPGPDLLTDMGTLETPAETEAQLLKQQEQVLRETWQTTCCHSKYAWRVMTLKHIVQLKTEEDEDDLDAWKWLHKLITQLGKHGMSSEESSIENKIEEVLHVKNMEWC
ncbi:hypothetical protein F5141DRAFT_1059277 [Pisolithus sp. B1]|nr:hypothetical protein F5141DRAFT_1059277 [Pisolithus sp. B1]